MLLKVLSCVEEAKDEIVNDESYNGNPVVHHLPVDRTIFIQDLNKWFPQTICCADNQAPEHKSYKGETILEHFDYLTFHLLGF